MLILITAPSAFIRALFKKPRELAIENLALRQQLAVLKHSTKRARLRRAGRVFWVWLSKLCTNWRSMIAIVQPDTIVRWHQLGFELYWARKSRLRKVGRPTIDSQMRRLIRRMCRENPLWGAPRILSELRMLGFNVSEGTVRKYRPRQKEPPSPGWHAFLSNHAVLHRRAALP